MDANLQRQVQVLGDPTRLAIFDTLGRQGPLAVVDLSKGLPITRPAVSQHLKVLKDAGLVFGRKAGTRCLYQVNPDAARALRDYFQRFWSTALAAFKEAAEKPEDP